MGLSGRQGLPRARAISRSCKSPGRAAGALRPFRTDRRTLNEPGLLRKMRGDFMEQGQKFRRGEIVFHPIALPVRPPEVADFRGPSFAERDAMIEFGGIPIGWIPAQIALRGWPQDFSKFGGRYVSSLVPSKVPPQVVPSPVGAVVPIPAFAFLAFSHSFRKGSPVEPFVPPDPKFIEWFCFLTAGAFFLHDLNHTTSGQQSKGGKE